MTNPALTSLRPRRDTRQRTAYPYGRLAAMLLTLLAVLPAARANATDESKAESGLFFRSDRPDVFLRAPTLSTEVHIAVNGTVERVRVRQLFHNPSDAWLEGIYVFPLPERSSVDRLRMRIGERVVVGEIKEREEASALYRKAAAAGQRASLVSSERPNIFTTSVANIGPGETVMIEIEYQDAVAVTDGRYSLRFPMVVGPRYIPGEQPVSGAEPGSGWAPDTDRVPDASRITPPVRHPDRGKINPLSLAVELDAGFPIDEVVSRYHPVVVAADGENRRIVRLAEGVVPADRDFLLEWTPLPGAAPRAGLFAEALNGDTYLLVTVLPPTAVAAPARRPREVVFVIDVSGSMAGASIEQAKAALLLALGRLAPGDRFNVIRFADTTSALFPEPRDWTPETLRLARRAVSGLEAEGGTEMRPALRLALKTGDSGGRLRQVVFLTDAAVGNEVELFEDIASRLGNSRLFTIGIGSAPNSYFMRKAAELGRGSFTYIGDVTEVSERMESLLRKLERPAMTDLTVAWPDGLPAEIESFPSPVPDLYDGEPVVFSARLPGVSLAALRGDLTLGGRMAGKGWSESLDLAKARPAEGVAALWARAKLSDIEDGAWRGGDPEAIKAAATDLALRHRLVTQYTSLVAVDREAARPFAEDLEQKRIATNLPTGWDYGKVFGQAGVAPAMLMQKTALPGVAGTGLRLPGTATPAGLHLLVGLLLLGLGAASLLTAGWMRRHA